MARARQYVGVPPHERWQIRPDLASLLDSSTFGTFGYGAQRVCTEGPTTAPRESEHTMAEWWQDEFQTTINAYYRGDLAAGRDACERLLSIADLPASIDLQTRRNLVFYAPPLAELAPSATIRPIDIVVREGWSRFNPSIATGPHGELRMIVRSTNYTMTRQLHYMIHDETGVIRTTNLLLDLSPDLEIMHVEEIDDRPVRLNPPLFPVAGFEDCRLFAHQGSWWFSGTVRDRNQEGVCQIALVRLDGATTAQVQLLSDASTRRHEKNWMPVPGDDALRFVYAAFPTIIVRHEDAEMATPEFIQPAPLVARRCSGGSQVIPLDGGGLCLMHEAVNFEDGGRVYTHRWVWFDAGWTLARLSPPFRLHDRGVEFAAGVARRGDDLVISYGVWDREAWLATVRMAEILSLLAPPLNGDQIAAEMRATATLVAMSSGHDTQPTATVPATAARDASRAGEITPLSVPTPTIVATTLSGNSREIIGDALRSAGNWVDWCLLVDTGITDDTVEIAHQIAGDKLVVRQFPWRDDFAAARNFALEAAAEIGADWAVTIDTDERLDCRGIDVRAALATSDADALHANHAGGSYGKERFFRLPARGRYVGPTHEAFIADGARSGTLPGVVFDELVKSPKDYRRKVERDIAILSRHTAGHPEDPRWFYYLGDSLAGLGRHEEAVAAFRVCASLNGWDEERAWALYRAAECLLKLDRPEEAVEACAVGMGKHAGLAELPWLAAYASWQAGRPAQAIYWARQAIAMGHFAGAGATVPRIGFRHPPALWEGPYDVLRFALRATGDVAGANEAEQRFQAARAARKAGESA
jgi:tetratricopeptide (TPR) repeat protein